MDPEARVVVTARDATAAAFASANRNVRQFSRSMSSIRSMFAGLGVAVGGRMFAGWISNAIRAAEATGEHADEIKRAKETLDDMKKASDALAVSLGTALVPAMRGVTAVLLGWNRIASGADPNPFEAQIERVREQIAAIRGTNISPRDDGKPIIVYTSEQKAEIERLTRDLDELIKKQREAKGLDDDASAIRMRTAMQGMQRIGDVADRVAGAKRPEIEVDWLDEDGLEEMVVEAREMTVDELLKPFPSSEVRKMFEPLKREGFNFAEAAGRGFKDSLVDAFMGIEVEWKDMLKRMAIEMGLSGIFDMIGGALSGGTSGVGKFFGKFFGGGRASGGDVRGGMLYQVHPGEAFFRPGGDGRVGRAGGGAAISIGTIDARGATDPAAVEAAVHRGVLSAVAISGAHTDAKLRAFSRPAMA